MSNELDTFDSDVVITPEDVNEEAPQKPENPEDDTFDNGYYENEESKDSQVDLLDEQDDSDQKPEDKKEEKKENDKEESKEEKDEEKPEKKKEKPEEKTEDRPSGKAIKIKDGDKKVEISPDATVKVKVKGKNEFVSIEDLKSNYSGKQAWSEKIEEANSKLEESELKLSKFQEEKQQIVQHLEKIAGMMDKEDGDPLEAMYYLLDMTGRDVNNYSKRIFDFMEEQVQAMSEMDDVEKDLYWTNKKLENLQSNQAAKAEFAKQEQAHRELIAKVDRLRESQGVSEEQYVQAHRELVKNGYKEDDLTPEAVINYQVMKPHVEKALDLTEQFEDDLSDDEMDNLVHETALTLKSYPRISEEDALIVAAKKLGFDVETDDDDIKKLNDEINDDNHVDDEPNLKAGKKLKEGEIESFDDFDYY